MYRDKNATRKRSHIKSGSRDLTDPRTAADRPVLVHLSLIELLNDVTINISIYSLLVFILLEFIESGPKTKRGLNRSSSDGFGTIDIFIFVIFNVWRVLWPRDQWKGRIKIARGQMGSSHQKGSTIFWKYPHFLHEKIWKYPHFVYIQFLNGSLAPCSAKRSN